MLTTLLSAMAVGRILLGLAPFVAAGPSARLLGFPLDHDSATARLMGRMFGVRDVGLGVLTFFALQHPEIMPFVLVFQGCTDLGDLVAIAIPLVRREGIDRGAWSSLAFALPAACAWFVVFAAWTSA